MGGRFFHMRIPHTLDYFLLQDIIMRLFLPMPLLYERNGLQEFCFVDVNSGS